MKTLKLRTHESDAVEMALISRMIDIDNRIAAAPGDDYLVEYIVPEYYSMLSVLCTHLGFQAWMLTPRVYG